MSERIADAKAFLEHAGVPVTFGLHDAYYRPDEDRIYMPARSAFDSDEAMIATEGHELVHATGHASRLARDTLRDYHKERAIRSEEHTSELQSLMRISYAVFCLKKKKKQNNSTRTEASTKKTDKLI